MATQLVQVDFAVEHGTIYHVDFHEMCRGMGTDLVGSGACTEHPRPPVVHVWATVKAKHQQSDNTMYVALHMHACAGDLLARPRPG